MWIVQVALRRPYTFLVMALLILLATPLVLLRMSTDIFPEINIPVISIVWTYVGLSAQEVGQRITAVNERSLTTLVTDIEHVESQSLNGLSIIKIFFQPNANIPTAMAQVVAVEQQQLKSLPPGAQPPLVIKYSASAIPVIQLGVSSPSMTEAALFDAAFNFLRPRLVTIPGAAIPLPFGGKSRQISVDIDTAALLAKGLTPNDIVNAVNAQNLILPSGTAKIGGTEYAIQLNGSPDTIEGLNHIPVATRNGATTYLSEVAHVRDGFAPQTNIVRQNGERGVLMSVIKNGGSSTLDIVKSLLAELPIAAQLLPPDVKITPLFDQSGFVRAAIGGVVREAVIAACLTAMLILVFLGNWRSTCIIAVSIPLSILSSVIALFICGETLNIMTLGGLALAVGILVDDATVTIENIERHLHLGSDLHKAILDGAGEIAVPALVSTLCICIVFVPMFFLSGVARFLFVPLAESVMFAMVFSFLLSRTLVPTMAKYLLRAHIGHVQDHNHEPPSRNPLVRFQGGFEARFMQMRAGYHSLLALSIERRRVFVPVFLGFVVASFLITPFLGRNFFPQVDGGQILMHVRAPVGMRLEETAARFGDVEKEIRKIIPQAQTGAIVDNIGTYLSSINTIYNNTGTINESDGDIQISLTEGHAPTPEYVARLRSELPRRFPGLTFSFLPADIVSQILNFGAPAPIDLQIRGNDLDADFAYANKLLAQIRHVPGVADARIQQSAQLPTLNVNIDRTRAQYTGVTAANVTNSLVVNLASSSQVAPTYWLNPKNGVTYPIALQTPQYQLDSLAALQNLPVNATGAPTTVLGGIADIRRSHGDAVVSQYDISSMVEVFATVQGRDLGSVSSDIRGIIARNDKDKPKGSIIALVGQTATMYSAYTGLLFGLLGAVVLIYFLIVINFQSWTDPFVIITALPAALAGIVWMLFATHTTLSVPALTGAIMCMGVATANSVLVISFAREKLTEFGDSTQAALEAGFVRLRPVLMTALAMVIGMLPMALGFGEGGEQNAPLGRAVIGGLIFATVSTLFFVPVVFSIIHRNYRALPEPEASLGEPNARA
jgi:CzcA family heavy metal efflux pump